MKIMMIEDRGHLESGVIGRLIGRESAGRLEIDDRLMTESVVSLGSMSGTAIETVTTIEITIENDGDEARTEIATEKEREIEAAVTTIVIVVEKETAKQDGDAIETAIQTGTEEAETADHLHQAESLAVVKTSGHGVDHTALEVVTAHRQTIEETLRLKTLEFTALLVPIFVALHQADKGRRQATTTSSDAVIGIGVRVANAAGRGADWWSIRERLSINSRFISFTSFTL
jgi:hypothetical protein